MTAFASAEIEADSLTINCELRSVNHRYCDVTLKLAERFRFAEAGIRPVITRALKRGKIECSLNYKKQLSQAKEVTVNTAAVTALLKATSQIDELMHKSSSFNALDVLKFPGIQQEPETNKDELLQAIKAVVTIAVNQLVAAREREGAQLAELVILRCNKISVLVTMANKRMPEVLEHIRNKTKERLAELVEDPDFDRLEQEMVFLTQKLDVAEELDRLDTHVKEVLSVLTRAEPIGRRLDFLMQEMHREANTLGSKSADKEMTQISIDLKVLIEQMREQIQNIE